MSRPSFLRFFFRTPVRKDITLVLVLKVIALFLLWELFFSHPVAEQLKKTDLVKRYLTI